MSTLFPSALLHLFGRLSCLAALVAFLAWPRPAFASEDGLLSTAMAGSANRAWPVAEVLVDPVAGSLELQTSTRTHIVGRGDTLDELARRYDTTVRAIVDANRIANPDRISEGQRLVIPIASARTGASRGGERLSIGFGPDGQISATLETEQRTSELANELAIGPSLFPALSGAKLEFLLSAIEPARESQRQTGVPASVTLAQAVLESDWGRSAIGGARNYFGIKATKRPGTAGVVWAPTREFLGGRWVTVTAPFRAYASMADSFVDHGRFFVENARYAEAMRRRDDPRAFARLVHQAGYATDPQYSTSLIRLMDRYDLYRFDVG